MTSTICDCCGNTILLEDDTTQTSLPIPEHFLRSDFIPTKAEVNEHSRVLEDDYALLDLRDQEIDRISQILEELQRKREDIMERIRLRETFLSPIRRVPVEIWRIIFELACFSEDPESPYSEPYSVSLNSNARDIPKSIQESDDSWDYDYKTESYLEVNAHPYVLLQVCTHWHYIVAGFPQLWSSILISGDLTLDLSPVLDSLLTKSGNSPLTIYISSYSWVEYLDPYNNTNAIRCISFLAEHAMDRCRRFKVLSRAWWPFLLSEETNVSFPVLESLEAVIPSGGSLCNLDAPLLSYMQISRSIHGLPSNTIFPYAQLTSLEFENDVYLQESVLDILPLCPSLQSLKAPFQFIDNLQLRDSIPPDDPIRIPSLQHLHIYITWFKHDLVLLFKHFQFPNLFSLEIEWRDMSLYNDARPPTGDIDFPDSFYLSLLGLQKLKFLGVISLLELLEATPSLIFIPLTIRSDNDNLTHKLLPKLSSISIYRSCFLYPPIRDEKTEFENNVLDMVESRAQDSQFQLRLEYSEYDPDSDEYGISAFEGLEKRMTHSVGPSECGLRCRIREEQGYLCRITEVCFHAN